MKAIMISIKPKWVAKILNGEKSIEIRKTMPKCELPIDVYIYCTKSDIEQAREYLTFEELKYLGKVVAKFTLKKISHFEKEYPSRYIDDYYDDNGKPLDKKFYNNTCLSEKELFDYIGSGEGYAWHIDNLVIFDKPKELGEFYTDKPNNFNDYFTNEIKVNGVWIRPIKKAPQSWCYVEVE